jgi:ribosomal protein S24E
MTERRNTLVCIFDHASPKISAKEIHDWIDAVLQVSKQNVK